MANTPRSENQLDALFLDNDLGDISAQDGRDFIATFFGHKSNLDPTPDNDDADSGGIGAFFSAGSRWLNTATQIEWVCYSGTPHLAIWQPAYNGFVPAPVPWKRILVRTTSAFLDFPSLGFIGLNGNTTNNTRGITTLIPNVAVSVNFFPWMAYPPSSIPSPQPVQGFAFGDLLNTRDKATANANITFDAFPQCVTAVEQDIDPVTHVLRDAPGGMAWDTTTRMLFSFNGSEAAADTFQEAMLIGNIGAVEVWTYWPPVGGSQSITIGGDFITNDVVYNYGGNTTNNVVINWKKFTIINWLSIPVFTGPTLNPGILPLFSPFQVLLTDVTGAIVTSGALGDGQLIIGASGGLPSVGSLASSDSSITITNTAGAIDLKVGGTVGGRTLQSVAATGTTQGTAAAITGDTVIVTSATAGVNDGVRLPAKAAAFIVIDSATVTSFKIYPPVGEQISGFGVNAPATFAFGATQAVYYRLADLGSGNVQWKRGTMA